MNKKAQIKMGETIALLFIFFILLIVGMIFYLNLSRASVSREISEFQDQKAVEISQVISFLPEFRCTEENVVREGCFDLHKLISLSEVAKLPVGLLFYTREFETTKISVNSVYPHAFNFTIFDNPKSDYLSAQVMNLPISLYNASDDSFYYGFLEVTVYE